MIRFEYLEPKNLQEATGLLATHGDKARLIAGGTDLLHELKTRHLRPQYVVNIKRIPGLNSIQWSEGDGLRFGALVTCRMLEYSPDVRKWFPMLAETAGIVGSVQIRSTATIMGNVCNALPSAEMGPPLLALNAEITLTGTSGSRTMSLEQFITGPRQTARRQDEIATEIHVPNVPANTGMIYVRHSPRRAMDLAVVGVAAVVTTDASHDVLQDVRIALGAVAPTPLRARRAEAIVQGQRYSEELLRRAGEASGEESKPISDIRASEEYRREMVQVLTRRMLHWARERSRLAPGEAKILRYPTSMHFIYTPAA